MPFNNVCMCVHCVQTPIYVCIHWAWYQHHGRWHHIARRTEHRTPTVGLSKIEFSLKAFRIWWECHFSCLSVRPLRFRCTISSRAIVIRMLLLALGLSWYHTNSMLHISIRNVHTMQLCSNSGARTRTARIQSIPLGSKTHFPNQEREKASLTLFGFSLVRENSVSHWMARDYSMSVFLKLSLCVYMRTYIGYGGACVCPCPCVWCAFKLQS